MGLEDSRGFTKLDKSCITKKGIENSFHQIKQMIQPNNFGHYHTEDIL